MHITLDAAGGENMLDTTRENLNKPMSTVFIETNRVVRVVDGETIERTVKTEEIINTATIRGIFKDKFQISGLTPGEARNLALLLRAGALAAPVYKVEERTIGPTSAQEISIVASRRSRSVFSPSLHSWRFTTAVSA